jgi:polo-like kinase 1
MGKFLGKGGFAKCYEATDTQTKEVFAAKVVQKASLNKSRAKQKLMSEIKIHKAMKSDGVVKFVTYFEDKENVYMILELCKNLSLNEMVKRRKRLTDVEAKYYVKQLVCATQDMHASKVIH